MKLMKKVIIVLACLFFILTMFAPLLSVNAAEAFTIEDYHVRLDIQEDGLVEVTETMSVHFDYQRHGIYFDIPTRYKMNWDIDSKNQQKEYYLPVTDLKVLSGQQYEVEEQSEGVRIMIGDPYAYAKEYETYIVSYDLQLRNLGYNDRQMFYYNLIGSWDTVIKNFSFEMNFPKPIDASKMEFYLGANPDNKQYVETEVIRNTIKGRITLPIGNSASFTVFLPLENGYFTYKELDNHASLISIVSSVMALMMCFVFLKYGKDEQVIVSIEFDAPDGISSAEVGYIIDGSIDNRDITSLLLDWGNKGYLKMEETDETDLVLTKLCDLDQDAPLYEQRMFEALFKGREQVSTLDLKETFYTDFNGCKVDLQNYLNQKDKRIYTRQSVVWRVLTFVIATLPSCFFAFFAIYAYSWQIDYGVLGAVLVVFPLIWADIILSILEDKYAVLSLAVRIMLMFLAVLCLVVNGVVVFGAGLFVEMELIYPLVIWLCTILLTLFGMKMIKRTKRGTEMYGRVLGLREFIVHAEGDRLKAMADENPELFYHVLPYAYAMDLTDVWSHHFENLVVVPPAWYVGHHSGWNTYHMTRRLNHSLMHMQSAMTSIPPVQSSSGGGSFGGGSSGGFSGGGFGGSRGGSW